MLPFGPRLTTVFASRWKALFWAAGVMVTAYFTATEARRDDPADNATPVAQSSPSGNTSSPSGNTSSPGGNTASPWAK